MDPNDVFVKWVYATELPDRQTVFPDGSRDILIIDTPGSHTAITLTDLDLRPRLAHLPAGTRISGYRLRPGLCVSQDVIDAAKVLLIKPASQERRTSASSLDKLESILCNEYLRRTDIDEAIAALTATSATVRSAARELGVSARTLQRLFVQHSLPTPEYWRLLARSRRAVILLRQTGSLVELATTCGYSDQAHMTRDLVRWFGLTPSKIKQDMTLLESISQPALGNWTGEHISTR